MNVRLGSENRVKVIPSFGASTLKSLNDVDISNIGDDYILKYSLDDNKIVFSTELDTLTIGDITVTGNSIQSTNISIASSVSVGGTVSTNKLYYSNNFNNNGIAYFSNSGELKSTTSPESGISTTNYVLTTDSSGVPVWTNILHGGYY